MKGGGVFRGVDGEAPVDPELADGRDACRDRVVAVRRGLGEDEHRACPGGSFARARQPQPDTQRRKSKVQS